jgi:hypothetical protein
LSSERPPSNAFHLTTGLAFARRPQVNPLAALILMLLFVCAPATLVALLAPLAAEAQQAGKVYRIGFLRAGEPLKLWLAHRQRRKLEIG